MFMCLVRSKQANSQTCRLDGKQDTKGTALWAKCPRCGENHGHRQRRDNMPLSIARSGGRDGRTREIEERACVGPFFDAGEARNQDRDPAKHLPNA